MKTKPEIAAEIGVTRQMLHGVITGRYNCGYDTAKSFSSVLGGGVEVWIYPQFADMRQRIFDKYRGRK
jgi:plasmid maintenance system antidote protein VapI